MRRTAVINQIRGLLLERGITLRQGRRHVDEALPAILEDANAKLSGAMRLLLVFTEGDRVVGPKIDANGVEIRATEREGCAGRLRASWFCRCLDFAHVAVVYGGYLAIVPGDRNCVPT